MNFQSTGNAKVQSIRCCVLFDPKDGSIRHTNRVITLEGATTTSEEQMEQRTLRLAASLGLDTKKLRPLHVNPEDIAPGHRYKVHTKTRSLTEIKKISLRTISGKKKTAAPKKSLKK
jgi:hypothetical protein